MKLKNLIFFLVIIIFGILTYSCANQGPSPAGGPKDSIPPTIINSVPLNQALNFKGSELYFEFDERINADKLKQQLIITPNTDLEYSFVTKKERLIIKLQSPLKDSTTYNFNFIDGVTDITEKNPVLNFRLAFSTGPFIDSMYVNGSITSLMSGEGQQDITVGLYDVLDTVDVFEKKPKYFITTLTDGSYSIENIKTGNYKIFAWKDENRNLKLDSESEPYGFKADTLSLFQGIDSVNMVINSLDARQPKVNSARPLGKYYNVKYNKQLFDYTVTSSENSPILANNLNNKEKLIRFYNTQSFNIQDSVIYFITARDSLLQTTIDTVTVKFQESKKKPDPFTSIITNKPSAIKDTARLTIDFSKPISHINLDSTVLAIDTISFIPLIDSTTSFTWNKNKTNIEWSIPVNWNYFNDSIQSLNKYFIQQDSLETDSTKKGNVVSLLQNQIFLLIKKGTFISVESDSIDTESIRLKKENLEDYSTMFLTLNTTYQHYWLELIDSNNDKVVRSIRIDNQDKLTINRIKPGKYKFRCKIDENNDGIWSLGNIRKDIEPEKMIQTGTETSAKANWEFNIDLSF